MAAGISICPARSRRELESVLEVLDRVSGGPLPAVEELEHTLASKPGSTYLLGHCDGEAGASGVGKVSSLVGCLFAMVRVLPEFRRRGVGRAMYSALEAAITHGFAEIGREFSVVLDLGTASPASPAPPAGVEITNLADRPDLARAAWAVEVEAAPDIPTEGEVEAWPFERWRSAVLEAPTALPARSLAQRSSPRCPTAPPSTD
jgi:GNAT superfamily N-acetyltransferase